MRIAYAVAALLPLALAMPAVSARAQSGEPSFEIMKPEKPAATKAAPAGKRKKRIGSSSPVYPTPLPPPQHFYSPPSQTLVTQPPDVPPALYVPQTGRVLPNLPSVSGSGPNGVETSQDRAFRCAHQAGVYGPAAGDRSAYIGSCINQ